MGPFSVYVQYVISSDFQINGPGRSEFHGGATILEVFAALSTEHQSGRD